MAGLNYITASFRKKKKTGKDHPNKLKSALRVSSGAAFSYSGSYLKQYRGLSGISNPL